MAKAKSKTKASRKNESRLIPIHIKLTPKEHALLMKRANWWCMGNLSAWFRYTGLKYVPKKDENVSLAVSTRSY